MFFILIYNTIKTNGYFIIETLQQKLPRALNHSKNAKGRKCWLSCHATLQSAWKASYWYYIEYDKLRRGSYYPHFAEVDTEAQSDPQSQSFEQSQTQVKLPSTSPEVEFVLN